MFDPKMQADTDSDILQEIIQMCEKHMGGGLKKPEEPAMPDPIAEEESSESPAGEEAPSDSADLEGADLDELMKMYESIKG